MPKNKQFWQFQNKAEGIGQLDLYGDISSYSWFGDEVTPNKFKLDLDALGDISTLNVYINSSGGDVFAGQAIHSMLKRHKATVNVYIDGLAASIASVIAMAGDKVIMPSNAMMMIHKPWTGLWGNSTDFRKMADDLDKIQESIEETYLSRIEMKTDDLRNMLEAETWLTAQECVDHGFADEIEQEKQVAASLKGGILMLNGLEMDLSKYANAPKFVAVEPREPDPEPRLDTELMSLYNLKSKHLERMINQC